MIEKMLVLQSGSFFGGGVFGDLLAEAEAAGFFSYLLPFLLIFALVNAILSRTNIFKGNKSVNGVIAFVIGLMALQFDFVPIFFSEIFPRLGIALAVILVLLIVSGLFLDPDDKGITYYTLLGISAIILIIVLVQTAGAVGWQHAEWWYGHWKQVAAVVLFIIIFAIAANQGSESEPPKTLLSEALRGN